MVTASGAIRVICLGIAALAGIIHIIALASRLWYVDANIKFSLGLWTQCIEHWTVPMGDADQDCQNLAQPAHIPGRFFAVQLLQVSGLISIVATIFCLLLQLRYPMAKKLYTLGIIEPLLGTIVIGSGSGIFSWITAFKEHLFVSFFLASISSSLCGILTLLAIVSKIINVRQQSQLLAEQPPAEQPPAEQPTEDMQGKVISLATIDGASSPLVHEVEKGPLEEGTVEKSLL